MVMAPATVAERQQQRCSGVQDVAADTVSGTPEIVRTNADIVGTPIGHGGTADVAHRTSLTADEARDILRETRDLLRPVVSLVREVIGGVSVLIEQDRDGLLHGRTDYAGEVRGWFGLTAMDRTQLRELAAMARALHTVGDDGRKVVAVYDSCSGAA